MIDMVQPQPSQNGSKQKFDIYSVSLFAKKNKSVIENRDQLNISNESVISQKSSRALSQGLSKVHKEVDHSNRDFIKNNPLLASTPSLQRKLLADEHITSKAKANSSPLTDDDKENIQLNKTEQKSQLMNESNLITSKIEEAESEKEQTENQQLNLLMPFQSLTISMPVVDLKLLMQSQEQTRGQSEQKLQEKDSEIDLLFQKTRQSILPQRPKILKQTSKVQMESKQRTKTPERTKAILSQIGKKRPFTATSMSKAPEPVKP